MAALFYCLAIAWVVRRRPEVAPQASVHIGNRLKLLAGVWPVLLIALMVVGGIYGGVFTPTEGAAFGAAAMLLVGLVQRSLNWRGILDSLKQTAETTGMIFIILLGSEVFNAFLARSQFPTQAAEWVTGLGLPPYVVMLALLALYIVLGAVMDELAMLLLTLPVFFPIVQALDFGLPPDEVAIWFGILVLIVVGIGLTAPPIGLNVFVISSIAKTVPIASTYRGVLPFIVTDIVTPGAGCCIPRACLMARAPVELTRDIRTTQHSKECEMAKKGYWIAHVNITNPERYKDYVAANAAPLKKYGARFRRARRRVAGARGQLWRAAAMWSSSSTAMRRPRPVTTRPSTRRRPRSATRPARPNSSSSKATRAEAGAVRGLT